MAQSQIQFQISQNDHMAAHMRSTKRAVQIFGGFRIHGIGLRTIRTIDTSRQYLGLRQIQEQLYSMYE